MERGSGCLQISLLRDLRMGVLHNIYSSMSDKEIFVSV